MRHSLQNNKAQSGFTLLEVLLSMALAATIGMAAYAMYANVLDATMHAQKELRGKDEPRAFFRILMQDLETIYMGEDNTIITFVLRQPMETRMSKDPFLVFATTNRLIPSKNPYSGMVNVDYTLDGDRAPFTVVRHERDYAGVSGDFKVRRYTLLRGVQKLSVSYWDEDTNSFSESWVNQKKHTYPSMIKLEATLADGKKELIIPLPVKEII